MNLIKKPLFWTNVAAFTVTGLVIAGVAFGWTNPSVAPAGGSGAITADSAGNVGIGTLSPTSKLHLNGKLRISDGTQGLNKVLSSNASGVASWVSFPGVTGIGTAGKLAKWTKSDTLGDSSKISEGSSGVTVIGDFVAGSNAWGEISDLTPQKGITRNKCSPGSYMIGLGLYSTKDDNGGVVVTIFCAKL